MNVCDPYFIGEEDFSEAGAMAFEGFLAAMRALHRETRLPEKQWQGVGFPDRETG